MTMDDKYAKDILNLLETAFKEILKDHSTGLNAEELYRYCFL